MRFWQWLKQLLGLSTERPTSNSSDFQVIDSQRLIHTNEKIK